MASTFYTISTFGAVASPNSTTEKKVLAYRHKLSSLAPMPPSLNISNNKLSFSRRRRGNCMINAMAKELYFNKDGSATKKLQVCFVNCKYLLQFVLYYVVDVFFSLFIT